MTPLGQKIRVEPLDDDRFARIEQRVMAGFPAAASRWPAPRSWPHILRRSARWLVPAVAMAGVVLAIYLNLRSSVGEEPRVADRARPVRVVTDSSGASTYDLGDATLVVGPSTTIEIRRAAGASAGAPRGAIDVELIAGHIDCEVAPRQERARFAVHAGDVHVTVVGTAFQVERSSASDTVSVLVSHGKVRVDSKDGSRLLGAGQSWSGPAFLAELDARDRTTAGQNGKSGPAGSTGLASDGDDSAGGDPTLRKESERQRAPERPYDDDDDDDSSSDRDGGDGSDDSGDSADGDGKDGAGHGDRVAAAGRDPALDLDSPGRESLRRRTARKPPSGKSAGRDRSASGSGRDRASRRRDPYQRALAGAKPTRHRPRSDGELAAIMALEGKDPDKAVARYRQIGLSRGDDAEFALYSMAHVQYFKLGQRGAALRSLSHYQRRFPRGAHAESALWLRIRILCEGDDRKSCRAAAHTYLNHYPQGSHARLAGKIVNWDM